MNTFPAAPERERILELQADRALQGLDEAHTHELHELLTRHAELDNDAMELAAAALDLSLFRQEQQDPLPLHLRDRLRQSVELAAPCSPMATRWFDTRSSLDEQYQELVASAPDLMYVEWQATADAAAQGMTGEVTWSNQLQRGFLRFRGLERNDRTAQQYQLWIFDRAQEHPVDGGVFDSNGRAVLIPIDPKIRVTEPWQFAVTVEKPGGVVVSKQERVVAAAVP